MFFARTVANLRSKRRARRASIELFATNDRMLEDIGLTRLDLIAGKHR